VGFSVFRSRTTAVVGGASLVVLALGSGAVASGMVTSADIKDDTIKSRDIHDGGVQGEDLAPGLLDKVKAPSYSGAAWSIIDRNVIGNGDAYLRSGPSAAGGVKPPSGIGSLGLRTGSGTDKAAFGDQVDFAGQALSGISTVSYWVFTTGENNSLGDTNLPSVAFEVNPHTAGRTFSTLVYVPTPADSNAWTQEDASTARQWYYTGAFGTDSGCNQTTYCTLAEAKAAAPDGTLYTAQVTKGRDYAFSGAVDDLQINDTVYDFEPDGVHATPAG
jgi:hypothetical protein